MDDERFHDQYRATVQDGIRQWVRAYGEEHPDREWLLSDRDTWERNPYYTGEAGPHPEDYEGE